VKIFQQRALGKLPGHELDDLLRLKLPDASLEGGDDIGRSGLVAYGVLDFCLRKKFLFVEVAP